MSRLWSWLRRTRAASRPTSAPPRPSGRPPLGTRVRFAFETLEDRLAPSATTLTPETWRNERFHIDDAVVAGFSGPTVQDAAATGLANNSFGSLIGLTPVLANTPYHGQGESVAVIDTGIDYTHADLGGGWGKRVLAGWDFANNDADPMDDNGHGTHVAGIIGSSNPGYAGVAPDVGLIALKVLGADGSGSYGAVESALQWVIANKTKYNIVSINLSLGSGNFNVNPYEFLDDEFATLKSQGVFIAVAAGNSFYSYQSQTGLGYPGVSPNVVSVGAVWTGDFGPVAWASGARDNSTAADRVASFSQRSSNLSILAPGAMITSTYLGGRYQSMAGTSMASPVIAGAAAILHQALVATGQSHLANQDGILSIMKSSGARVVDGDDENDNVVNSGLAFQRLNLAGAMYVVNNGSNSTPPPPPPVNGAPVLGAVPDQRIAPGGSFTVALSATDPNGDAIVFSARVIGQGTAADAKAYELKQSLGLYNLGSYYTNSFGLNEKWLGGSGGAFYTLLPSGEIRRWTGTAASTMTAVNLIATLDARFYADPTLLTNAQPATVGPIAATIVGSQLTVATTAAATGSYQIEVTASDGQVATTTTFRVTVGNTAPIVTVASRIAAATGATTASIPITVSDPDGDPITISASTPSSGEPSQAYRLKTTYSLAFTGNYFTNVYRLGEKWLKSEDGLQFYCLLPNGELHRFNGSVAALTSASTLIARLDQSFYDDPSKLWNAAPPAAAATVKVVGNQVVVQLQQPYKGSIAVDVTVSDGVNVVTKKVTVTFA